MNNEPTQSALVFTVQFDGITPAIYTEAIVCSPFENNPEKYPVKALWDTGANISCISERMVNRLGLSREKFAHMTTASGTEFVPVYTINIEIGEGLVFPVMEVSEFFLGSDDSDLIVGMDVLTQGDLAITNWEGKTVLSFRVPSIECIDFSFF